MQGVSKRALQGYSKCYCVACATKAFILKGVQGVQGVDTKQFIPEYGTVNSLNFPCLSGLSIFLQLIVFLRDFLFFLSHSFTFTSSDSLSFLSSFDFFSTLRTKYYVKEVWLYVCVLRSALGLKHCASCIKEGPLYSTRWLPSFATKKTQYLNIDDVTKTPLSNNDSFFNNIPLLFAICINTFSKLV
jgi:hypothetical protein